MHQPVHRKRAITSQKKAQRFLSAHRQGAMVLLNLCLVFILCWGGSQPSVAQSSFRNGNETASIVLDGKPLFELQDFKNFSASDRANQVNSTLAESQWASSVPSVDIVARNNVLTLQLVHPAADLEPQYLLTITEGDLLPGLEARVQAQSWQKMLTKALKTAHQERTPQYIQQMAIRCGLLILGTILIHLCLRGGKQFGKQLDRPIEKGADGESRLGQRRRIDSRFLSLALLGGQALLWLGLFFYISDQFPLLRRWRYAFLNNIATQPLFVLNQQSYSASDLFVFAALLIGLWVAVRSLTVLLRSRILSVLGIQRGLQEAISVLTQYVFDLFGADCDLAALGY